MVGVDLESSIRVYIVLMISSGDADWCFKARQGRHYARRKSSVVVHEISVEKDQVGVPYVGFVDDSF